MSDAAELVDVMMHLIGKATSPLRKIDSEIEDLSKDALHGIKAFSYLRYNVEMTKEDLDKIGIKGLCELKIANLMNMDLAENVDLLMQICERAAKEYVKETHFPEVFDLL